MTATNFPKRKSIPGVSTKKSTPFSTNFARGIFTYKPNDAMAYDEIYLAQNARFDRIGEYKTRRGLSKLCEPVGKKEIQDNYSTSFEMTNATNVSLNLSTEDPIYSITLKVAASDATDYGVLTVNLLDEAGEVVASSAVDRLSTIPTDVEFIFKDAPSGAFTLKASTQSDGAQKFRIATLADGTPMYKLDTAITGKIIGIFEANVNDETTIIFAFCSHYGQSTLFRMSDSGEVNMIRVLPEGVKKVRFSQNINKIRYVDGKEGPRLIDPTNWSDTAIPTADLKTEIDLNIKTSNILEGTQDNMIYFDAETGTQAVWTYPYGFAYAPEADYTTTATMAEYVPGETTTSTVAKSTIKAVSDTHLVDAMEVGDLLLDDEGNYGEITTITNSNVTVRIISHAAESVNSYDAFDRDFRQNFPAIETGDPLTAMFNLGGIIYFLTRRNKYYMYSQTADVWTQQASSAQHGTFSQESVACNLNYAYYANDDGIYVFDGSSEASLTQNTIQSTYDAISGKESIVLELFGNRLYVFYSTTGDSTNNACLVYNINLKVWESFDTGLPVSATIARQTSSNRFICGSSRFGQLFTYENQNNAYADLGAPIDFDLETSYLHFGTPSQLHRVTKWRPEFAMVDGDYSVKCGYAADFTDDVEYAYSINLKNGAIVDEHYIWDNPSTYGNAVTPTKLTTIPKVYGQFRRVQLRYQHHAAFEPVNFKSHTLCVQTERIR